MIAAHRAPKINRGEPQDDLPIAIGPLIINWRASMSRSLCVRAPCHRANLRLASMRLLADCSLHHVMRSFKLRAGFLKKKKQNESYACSLVQATAIYLNS